MKICLEAKLCRNSKIAKYFNTLTWKKCILPGDNMFFFSFINRKQRERAYFCHSFIHFNLCANCENIDWNLYLFHYDWWANAWNSLMNFRTIDLFSRIFVFSFVLSCYLLLYPFHATDKADFCSLFMSKFLLERVCRQQTIPLYLCRWI